MKVTVLACGCAVTRDMFTDKVLSVYFCATHIEPIVDELYVMFDRMHFQSTLKVDTGDGVQAGEKIG